MHSHCIGDLVSGVWQDSGSTGVTLTSEAFSQTLGPIGSIILFICGLSFGSSTIFTQSHYGTVCAKFLFGENAVKPYQYFVILSVGLFAIVSIDFALNIIDGAFAMMAIPTLISAIWLAPKVVEISKEYFKKLPN